MLAQQLRESSSLFDSLDAMRHWRALLLVAASFLAAMALWGLGGWLLGATGWLAWMFLCAGLAGLLLLWAGNSAGILMMDDVAGQPGRSVGQAMRAALGATQQLVLVLLALALFYLIGLLALTVLLLICSVPVVGAWLYAVVFPVATVASGVALFVLPALVFPLCAPAVWRGLDASTGLAQLWAVVRQRLSLVLTWMLVLGCITAVVWLVLLGVLLLGASMAGGVSASVLGAQSLWSAAGVFSSSSPMLDRGMATAAGQAAGLFAYARAAAAGSAALFAAACAVPTLVAMRGACIVYRRALLGLNTVQEEQALSQTLMSAKKRARDLQASAAWTKPPHQAGDASFSKPEEEPPESLTTRPAVARAAVVPPVAASSWLQAEFAAGAAPGATAAFPVNTAPATPTPLFQAPPAAALQPPASSESLDLDLEIPFGGPASPAASAVDAALPCPLCGGATERTDFFCGHCGHALR